MRIKNLDLIGAILISVINVAWTQVPNRPLVVGIVLALPLIFISPGYTLSQILFRKRSPDPSTDSTSDLILRPSLVLEQPIGSADQIILSLGLSMAIDVLVGFCLSVFPIGLQALSWTLSLGLLTTIFALLAAFLRRKDIIKVAKTPKLRVTMYDGTLFGLAILLATIAIWASIIRPLEPQPSFTQFWMLPANQASKSCAVSIGVQSFESTPVTYRVVLAVNGSQTDTWSSIALAPQKEWVQRVLVTSGSAGTLYIEALLYRTDKPGTVYRNVHLTFHIFTGSKKSLTQQQCTPGM